MSYIINKITIYSAIDQSTFNQAVNSAFESTLNSIVSYRIVSYQTTVSRANFLLAGAHNKIGPNKRRVAPGDTTLIQIRMPLSLTLLLVIPG